MSITRAKQSFLLGAALALVGSVALGEGWRFEGPEGADVLQVVEDPTSFGGWYARTADNGTFASVDDGRTWAAANAGLPLGVNHLEVAPSGTLFVSAIGTTAIFVSYDHGASWIERPVPDADPTPWVFWVRAFGDSVFAVTWSEILQSFDDGRTWETWAPLSSPGFWRLHPSANDSDVMLAWRNDWVWRTADRGATWSVPLAGIVVFIPGRAVDEYLAIDDDGRVIQTLDGGASWDHIAGPSTPYAVAATAGYRDFTVVVAHPQGLLGLDASGLLRQLHPWDGWRWVGSIAAASRHDLLLVGDSEGVMRRSGTDLWQFTRSGLRGLVPSGFAWDPETGLLAVGSQYQGPWLRSGRAPAWHTGKRFSPGVNNASLAVVHDDEHPPSSKLFWALGGRLFVSKDGGETHEEAEWDSDYGTQYYINTIETQPERPGWMSLATATFINGTSIYDRSEDGGETWEGLETGEVDSGLPDVGWSLWMDPDDPLHMVSASASRGTASQYWCYVKETVDGGDSWAELLVLPSCSVARLERDPSDPGILYFGGYYTQSPLAQGSMHDPIFLRSLDGGQTWNKSPDGPPCIRDLEIDPQTGRLFLACDTIHYTDDHGDTWNIANLDGLPPDVQHIRLVEIADGRLYAGTNAGLYSIGLGEVGTPPRAADGPPDARGGLSRP